MFHVEHFLFAAIFVPLWVLGMVVAWKFIETLEDD